MKILIQKVEKAKLYIEEEFKDEILSGYVIFLGIENKDDKKLEYIINNILNLKIGEDDQNHFKFSILENKPEIMIIPNITIASKFNKYKPEFNMLPNKDEAKNIYEKIKLLFNNLHKENIISKLVYGDFGSNMKVDCIISGPVNFYLDL